MSRHEVISNNTYPNASYFWLIRKNIPREIMNVMNNVICPESLSNITA